MLGDHLRRLPLYAAVFLVGFAIMGFEMIASRSIVPWFGGGIDTWAALISTVLAGLMLGYFAGGALPPRWKTPNQVAALLLAAAFYIALLPLLDQSLLRAISDHMGEGAAPLLLSTTLVCLVPVTLLGMFAPCSVDLMDSLTSRHGPGEIAGQLYGISTLGSVCGTLATAFALIPSFGSARIALLLAAITFAAGALLWIHPAARDVSPSNPQLQP
jgi:predicted membrane-bound spermidine synthase